jgi:3-deoxy-D-manno-octulosonate 8-phosphate phosphatase (KDO 8-P phosphatase)
MNENLERPQAIVIDIDGTLTNGRLTIDHNGEKLFKQFHTRDIRAIRELVFNGYEVYLITADEWEGAKHFAEKVGAYFLNLRDKSHVLTIINKPFIAIGDDAWDIPMLNDAEEKYCPKDADYKVKQVKGINILKTKGGAGVVAELINQIL